MTDAYLCPKEHYNFEPGRDRAWCETCRRASDRRAGKGHPRRPSYAPLARRGPLRRTLSDGNPWDAGAGGRLPYSAMIQQIMRAGYDGQRR